MWRLHLLSESPGRLPEVQQLLREYILLPDAWAYQGGLPADLPKPFQTEMDRLPTPAVPPHGEVVIAVDGSDVAVGQGFLVPFDDGTAELKRLYVRPSGRSAGAGTALVTKLVSIAQDEGYRSVVLDVMPSRTQAIRLYERLEFVSVKPFRVYEHHEMSFMRRHL